MSLRGNARRMHRSLTRRLAMGHRVGRASSRLAQARLASALAALLGPSGPTMLTRCRLAQARLASAPGRAPSEEQRKARNPRNPDAPGRAEARVTQPPPELDRGVPAHA